MNPTRALALVLALATALPASAEPLTKKDAKALIKACEKQEDGEACWKLFVAHRDGDGVLAKDELKRAFYSKRACQAKHPQGCYERAVIMEEGKSAVVDTAGALEAYEISCEDGSYVPACEAMTRMVLMGAGAEADSMRGEAILEKACEKGVEKACKKLEPPPPPEPEPVDEDTGDGAEEGANDVEATDE